MYPCRVQPYSISLLHGLCAQFLASRQLFTVRPALVIGLRMLIACRPLRLHGHAQLLHKLFWFECEQFHCWRVQKNDRFCRFWQDIENGC